MKHTSASIALLLLTLHLVGCFNMPTPPSQIIGARCSGIQYAKMDAKSLALEYDSLSERESDLVIAQNQRIKTSQMQAFWTYFGQGDGMEAVELARVRGEKEAVKAALAEKSVSAHQ
jgi:hypothetical protein